MAGSGGTNRTLVGCSGTFTFQVKGVVLTGFQEVELGYFGLVEVRFFVRLYLARTPVEFAVLAVVLFLDMRLFVHRMLLGEG
jgi:hypothetical protein